MTTETSELWLAQQKMKRDAEKQPVYTKSQTLRQKMLRALVKGKTEKASKLRKKLIARWAAGKD